LDSTKKREETISEITEKQKWRNGWWRIAWALNKFSDGEEAHVSEWANKQILGPRPIIFC